MNVLAKIVRTPTAAVLSFINDAMIKAGVPVPDAAKIAELMLEADLIGADAHGVFRLPQYVQRLKLGSTNARPNIKGRLPSRRVTDGIARAAHALASVPSESVNVALHPMASAKEFAEIFKKTSCAAGLKPSGPFVAKDIYEIGVIPLLMKTLLDHGHADGDCIAVAGQTTAENLKSVKPIAAAGGAVGLKGNFVPEGAIVKVAGMLQDGDIIEIDAEAGTNVKLSDADLAGHETKWRSRATNDTSGALWKYAQQIGPAVDGAVTHPGGGHEKQCYADI